MPPLASPYSWFMLAGIGLTLFLWSRLARRDERLFLIYLAALGSAFVGAKVVYLLAEGWLAWHDPQRWLIWATGKSVVGALLGGYVGVEVAKRSLGYRQTTGDFFALVAPLGIMLGRVGCLFHGCCLGAACQPAWYTMRDVHGIDRWPAVAAEFVFNAVALLVFGTLVWLRRRRPTFAAPLRGQLFHLYLVAYGLFRIVHEFWRDTPRLWGSFSGYQVAALAVSLLGVIGFRRRWRSPAPNIEATSARTSIRAEHR